MKKFFPLLLMVSVAVVFAACGESTNADAEDKETITVVTSPGTYSELFLDEIKPLLEEDGFEVETVDFSELLQADIALQEGSIDVNVDQHTAYYTNFNNERDANLTGLTPIPTVPTGIYPGRKDSLDDVEEGDIVAIPQDPSNAASAYALLEKAGWIELEEGIEVVQLTQNNIEENVHGIDIQEMDSAQIPRALEDIDYGVIPGSIVYASGVDASTSLLHEDIQKDLELVATVDEKNADTEWAQAIKAAYESDEFKAYMEEHNQDGYWFIPEELR